VANSKYRTVVFYRLNNGYHSSCHSDSVNNLSGECVLAAIGYNADDGSDGRGYMVDGTRVHGFDGSADQLRRSALSNPNKNLI